MAGAEFTEAFENRMNTLKVASKDENMSHAARELADILLECMWPSFMEDWIEQWEYTFSELEDYGYIHKRKAFLKMWIVNEQQAIPAVDDEIKDDDDNWKHLECLGLGYGRH